MTDLAVPSVHINGTSRVELIAELVESCAAVRATAKTLERGAPNARDYYVQGPSAFSRAQEQHESRLRKLREVLNELETVLNGIVADTRKTGND